MSDQRVVDALQVLKEIVKKKGEDFVYPTKEQLDEGVCAYTHDGAPSCIVGYYWHRTNPVLFDFLKEYEEYNGSSPGGVADAAYEYLREQGGEDDHVYLMEERLSKDPVNKVLQQAQAAQDEGVPWGGAYTRAEEYARDNGWID